MSLGAPLVDELRNEIDTGLVGHHKAFLQTATHAQAVGAKLFEVRTRLFVETDVDLT